MKGNSERRSQIAENRELWIQGSTVITFLLLAVAAVAAVMSQRTTPDNVKIAASSLRSASSATRQLLEQYQRGEVTEKYYQAHIELLESSVKSEYDALNTTSVDDTVRLELSEARNLAFDLDGVLRRLKSGTADLNASRADALQFTQKFAAIEERARQKGEE